MQRPSLTVVAVTGVDREGHQRAIDQTLAALPFEAHSMLIWKEGMDLVQYSRFVAGELWRCIGSDYALLVQADGMGLHKDLWQDGFFAYSYLGAPWPYHPYTGNGGCSLRSREFLEASAKMPPPEFAEDQWLCCACRGEMEALGIRYAPPEVAAKFSYEHPVPELNNSRDSAWGVHGVWNL